MQAVRDALTERARRSRSTVYPDPLSVYACMAANPESWIKSVVTSVTGCVIPVIRRLTLAYASSELAQTRERREPRFSLGIARFIWSSNSPEKYAPRLADRSAPNARVCVFLHLALVGRTCGFRRLEEVMTGGLLYSRLASPSIPVPAFRPTPHRFTRSSELTRRMGSAASDITTSRRRPFSRNGLKYQLLSF